MLAASGRWRSCDGVGDRGQRVAQLVGEHRQELVLAPGFLEQIRLVLPPLRDIPEDEDDSIDLAAGVADGCPAVVDRPLDAVAGDEHRMIGQADDAPSARTRSTGFSDGSRVCSLTIRKTSPSGWPVASSPVQPQRDSATGLMKTTRPFASVAMTASPMLVSTAESQC